MTAREYIAPLTARLRTALADEKQRVNLLVLMGLAGLVLLALSAWLPADDAAQPTPAAVQDTVDVRAPHLLEDDEVDGVLDDTLNMIAQDNMGALSVHGGLSQSRVFALLGL